MHQVSQHLSRSTNIVPLQVVYAVNSWQHTRGMVVAGAGRGDEVVPSLNPAAGRGLTHLLRFGSAPHQRARGSGVGGTLRLSPRLHASAAHLVDAGARRPPCGLRPAAQRVSSRVVPLLYRSPRRAERFHSHDSPLCISFQFFSSAPLFTASRKLCATSVDSGNQAGPNFRDSADCLTAPENCLVVGDLSVTFHALIAGSAGAAASTLLQGTVAVARCCTVGAAGSPPVAPGRRRRRCCRLSA